MRFCHYPSVTLHAQNTLSGTMRILIFSLLFSAYAVASGPSEFKTDQFDTQVKQKENTLIMFYAPWCGHCKRLKPEYEAAAELLHSELENVQLARVDCTTEDKLCSQFSVTGYPTVKFFKNGELISDYSGPRDKDGIVRFMRQRSQPPSILIESAEKLKTFTEEQSVTMQPVVITYVNSESDEWMKSFHELAGKMLDDVAFGHVFDPSVAELSDVKRVRLYRPKNLHGKLEDSSVIYDGELTIPSLQNWILKHSFGLVGYRTPDNLKFFPDNNLLVMYNNVSMDQHVKGVNYFRNRLIKLIRSIKDLPTDMIYCYSHSVAFGHELSELGHESSTDFPIIVIYSNGKKYKLEKYTPDNFVEFMNKFKSGDIEPYIKSEPIPTEQSGPALKVVALNFDKVVNDPNKDVFIMFHAPWCGHCKQLMPKFENVAKKLKDEPNLILVTYDATANEVPRPFSVTGFPTLYFVPKNSKNDPKSYEGGREEDDLLKYLAAESTDELTGYDRQGKEKKTEL